jgi:hypothetical protein
MSRRVTGGALVVASALLGVPQAYGETAPPPQLPMATGCTAHVSDIASDATPTWGAGNVNGVPNVADPRGSVPGLDIRGVTFRVTSTKVYAFMSLDDIPATLRDTDSAYGYIMWFNRGSKVARFDQVYVNPTHAAQGWAPTSGYPIASVGSTQAGGVALKDVTGGVDATKNVAWVSVGRATFDTALGEPLVDGETLTAIAARTELWEPDSDTLPGVLRRPADHLDATGPAATWNVGDDGCFAPSKVTVSSAAVQYGDAVALTATLTDDADKPLADRTVTFTVPGEGTRTLTTDSAGVVKVSLPAAPAAQAYKITVTYAGDDLAGPGVGTGTLTVRTETVKIAPLKVTKAGTSRTVTATLTEDDPRAFAKQPVAWYVNGKKVATTSTDASGRAVFKAAKPGQKVQARYAGAAGRYAAASSNTVTV